MKIKSDFVTNSSSSSFIVFFKKKVSNIDDIKEVIERDSFSEIIFRDCMSQTPYKVESSKRFISEISELMKEGNPSGFNYSDRDFCSKHGITQRELYTNSEWMSQYYDEEQLLLNKFSQQYSHDLIEQYKGMYAYVFEYGDEGGGIYAELEHQNDWGGLPYIQISKH